jgi:cell division protein FtsI/penicillin-binding protein 2
MKFKPLSALLSLLLVGCSLASTQSTPTPTLVPTPTLGKPGVSITSVPSVQSAAQTFLQAWKDEDYPKMYGLLTSISQDAISAANFEKRYRDVAVNMTLTTIDYQVLSSLTNPASAQVSYQVVFHTTLLGDITPDNMVMNLSLNKGNWQIQWDDGMIMPALKGGNKLRLDYEVPARGNIYDRNGHAIVAQADAVALGVVPGEINSSQESTLLDKLSTLTGLDRNSIKDLYKNANPDWYIAVGEASADVVNAQMSTLSGLSGLRMTAFRSRYYYEGGIAPQTIGYVQPIPAEDLESYQRQGYYIGQKVGMDGLELWGEKYLAGTNGATLYVVDPNGAIITRLAHIDPIPSQSIYTTLDKDYQIKLQKSLGDFRGAVVVLERDSGKVLAMVSSPGFDPNLFEPTNVNKDILAQVLSDPANPLYNRADQGLYPLGSVFKIMTMSAALETGVYTAQSTYNCGYYFTELEGFTGHDWTLDHKVPASGLLTLPQGLMRSCNPFFWHIGLDLYNQGYTTAVSDMAHGFGLGQKTGFELPEQAGQEPAPASPADAVQAAIGQGATQVTPLQVARFVAAVGNGGTLYQPQIVDKIAPPDGNPTVTFKAIITGTLPISAANLKIVQDAMISVITNKNGTAHYTLANLSIPVAGKTGTATTSNGDPHAWFAGYTMANNPDKPDIAIAVILENAGEGSVMAAPIFRRAVTLYFSDNTDWGTILPWESRPYVVASPTPEVTDTPVAKPAASDTATPAP